MAACHAKTVEDVKYLLCLTNDQGPAVPVSNHFHAQNPVNCTLVRHFEAVRQGLFEMGD